MPTTDAPPADPPMRRRWGRWAVAAALLLGLVAFYALGLHRYLSWDALRGQIDHWKGRVEANPLAAAGLFFLAYVAATSLSLPIATGLSLVAGALFGRWLGTGLVLVAATLGATLAFLSSRYVLRDVVQRRFAGRLRPLDEGIARDGAFYLLTLRLVPVFPFFLVNLGMGLTPLRVRTFVWVSLLGMLPGTFVYVNAGAELGSLATPADVFSPGLLLALALLGVVPLALRLLLRRFVGSGRPPVP